MAAVLHRGDCYNIENVLALCQISEEKIRLASGDSSGFSRYPALTFNSGRSVSGFQTVASYLATIAKQNGLNLLGNSPVQRAEVDQWVEFCQTHVERSTDDKSVRKAVLDMDNHLSSRVYFVGDSLTLADVTVFYSLHGYMMNWSCQEKEQHINASRWFSKIQSLPEVRQHLMEVQFYRNVLYS